MQRSPLPPVVPGNGGAQRPEDQCTQSDACSACGRRNTSRIMERHGGMRMMLCTDSRACVRRVKINA